MGIRGRLLGIILAVVLPLALFVFFSPGKSLMAYTLAALTTCLLGAATSVFTPGNTGERLRRLDEAVQKIAEHGLFSQTQGSSAQIPHVSGGVVSHSHGYWLHFSHASGARGSPSQSRSLK